MSGVARFKIDAYYLMNYGMYNYTKEYHNYLQIQVKINTNNKDGVDFQNESFEDYLKRHRENLKILEKATEFNEKKQKKLLLWNSQITQLSALLGVFFYLCL